MTKFYPLRVSDIRRETNSCVSVAFEVPQELKGVFAFKAGQYLTLRSTINGEDLRRSYSLCSSPYEQEWRVAIKAVPEGKFSTFANETLKVGDIIDVMPPQGQFVSPDKPLQQVLCFAAGSGITPIISLIRQWLREEQDIAVTLIYGNRNSREIIFREQLEGLKNQYLQRFRLFYVLSAEHLGIDMFYGRIDEEKCRAFAKTLYQAEALDEVFICGPEPMILGVKDAVMEAGLSPKQVHFELFGAPATGLSKAQVVKPSSRQADVSEVRIRLDDKLMQIQMFDDGSHILEAAMGYGIELPYSCKAGVCSTCKCKVLEGEVLMEINYALEPDEVEAGYVLSCQSKPVSEKVLISFDE